MTIASVRWGTWQTCFDTKGHRVLLARETQKVYYLWDLYVREIYSLAKVARAYLIEMFVLYTMVLEKIFYLGFRNL